MDVTIRPAGPGDGEGIARCHLDSARQYVEQAPDLFRMPDTAGLVEWIEEDLARDRAPDELQLVAVADGAVVGTLEGRLHEPMDSAHWQVVREVGVRRLFVDALAVAEPYRRRGVGRRLMEEAEAWGRERGAELLLLDTWLESRLSVPFYEALGYTRRSVRFDKRL